MRQRPRVSGFVLGVALSALYLGARFPSLAAFSEAVDHTPDLMHDFWMYFYRTGLSLREGAGPVGGFLYPPLFGILMVPVSLLSVPSAKLLWGILEAVATLLLAGLAARFAPVRVPWVALSVMGTLVSVPALHNFKWGQMGVPLALMAVVAGEWVTWRRGVAVALVSFATAIKLYPAAAFALFLRRRDVRSLFGGAALTGFFLVGAPALVLGVRGTRKFFQKIEPYLTAAAGTPDPNSQSLGHYLARTFEATPSWLPWLAAALLLGTAAWLLHRAGGEGEGGDVADGADRAGHTDRADRADDADGADRADGARLDRYTIFLALSLIPLLVPTAWANYFAYLPPFAAFLAAEAQAVASPAGKRVAEAMAAAIILASSFLAVDLADGWDAYVRGGVLLFASLTAALLALALLARRPRSLPRIFKV